MDKFLLGLLTGVVALIAPLVVASLFLPGPQLPDPPILAVEDPEPTVTAGNPEPTPAAQDPVVTAPKLPGGPNQWRTSNFPKRGFAIDTPAHWHTANAAQYAQLADTYGTGLSAEGRELAKQTVLLLSMDDPDAERARGVLQLNLIDAPTDDVMFNIGVILQATKVQAPISNVIVEPKPVRIGGFDGAMFQIGLITRVDGTILAIETSVWLLTIDGNSVLVTMVAPKGDEGVVEQELLDAALNSLRPSEIRDIEESDATPTETIPIDNDSTDQQRVFADKGFAISVPDGWSIEDLQKKAKQVGAALPSGTESITKKFLDRQLMIASSAPDRTLASYVSTFSFVPADSKSMREVTRSLDVRVQLMLPGSEEILNIRNLDSHSFEPDFFLRKGRKSGDDPSTFGASGHVFEVTGGYLEIVTLFAWDAQNADADRAAFSKMIDSFQRL